MQILKEEVYRGILEAAAELFLKNGFEATTLADISARAGVSKSNLYNYFRSKREIYRRLTDGSARKLQDEIEAFRGEEYRSPDGTVCLGGVADRVFRLFCEERRGLLLLLRGTGTGREELLAALVGVFAEKFGRYLPEAPAGELLAAILARNLFDGMIEILLSGLPDAEVLGCLRRLVLYHSRGVQALIAP